MNSPSERRLDFIDPDLAREVLSYWETQAKASFDLLQSSPSDGSRRMNTYHSVATCNERVGQYRYALGHPTSAIVQAFKTSAHAQMRAQELRHDALILHPFKDYSIGNSWQAFRAACLALAAGEPTVAEQLARLLVDPAGARYVGSQSEVCTPEQQKVALGFRSLYEGAGDTVAAELTRVSFLWNAKTFPKDVAYLAGMIGALIAADRCKFLDGVTALLAWHAGESRRPENHRDPNFFLSIPCLGLSAIALTNRLVISTDLPVANVFLPLDLLSLG